MMFSRLAAFLIIGLSVVVGGLGGLWLTQRTSLATAVPYLHIWAHSPTPIASPSPSPTVAPPVTLSIPSLNLTAPVESVGLDAKGNMDVPKHPANVGWYQLGAKPGEVGSAVLAGHLDWYDGPAIFADLDKVTEGSEIIVTDQTGKTHRFRVTKKSRYPFNLFPLQEVFAAQDKSRLNLITCGGNFNDATKNYSHRIVVYSERIPETKP